MALNNCPEMVSFAQFTIDRIEVVRYGVKSVLSLPTLNATIQLLPCLRILGAGPGLSEGRAVEHDVFPVLYWLQSWATDMCLFTKIILLGIGTDG